MGFEDFLGPEECVPRLGRVRTKGKKAIAVWERHSSTRLARS